jgi:hypothetical protein
MKSIFNLSRDRIPSLGMVNPREISGNDQLVPLGQDVGPHASPDASPAHRPSRDNPAKQGKVDKECPPYQESIVAETITKQEAVRRALADLGNDILTVKGLVRRLGAASLHTLIDAFAR